jgi:hypothetical protein
MPLATRISPTSCSIDGYDQMAAITGKGPSTRHEIFYLGESSDGAYAEAALPRRMEQRF